MAKKTALKKSKRRLKRTVRRSMAAVLMVTAIAVAAIPVPENFAAPEDGTANMEVAIQYEEADHDLDYEDNATNTKNPYADLSSDSADIAQAIADGNLNPTEVIIQDTAGTYLTWQFLYKPLTQTTGLVCKYNDRFRVEKVDLGLQPVSKYYTVTADDFTNYFINPTGVSADLRAEMDNLRTNNPVYPTNLIRYAYDNYDSTTGSTIGLDQKAVAFLKDYYGGLFEEYTLRFKNYWDAYNANPSDTSLIIPDPMEVSPADLNSTDQIRFFCEHNTVLAGTDYKLTPVTDYRLGKDGTPVYVAYGGRQEQLSGGISATIYEDYEGYIVTKDAHSMNVIGEKAFYRVENVGQIEISGQVRNIGDSAFEKSGISSLYIGNAEMIGNRSFYECSTLKSVTFGENSGTHIIGAEAFRASGINTKLILPYTIEIIGHGAFSDCVDLAEVEFDQNNSAVNLRLKKYAFYNDKRLTNVNFGKIGVESMGKGCFAIQSPSGDAMTSFAFPTVRFANMDEYILANRRGLSTVSIPNYQKKIPENTFYNCFGLEKVEFTDDSATASFEPKLFYYVTNPDFCVYGPEFYNGEDPAYPRVSTWDAERKDGQGIPYVYVSGGTTYYEVALESEDGTRYRYGAGNDGELISCALITRNPGRVDIVIPSKIGNFDIKSIGSNCFSNEDLRKVIRTITIQDNSVSEIADRAFKDLPILSKVRIGDSVTRIGSEAFAGCKQLTDVYFTKPTAGYDAVSFGASAFVTTGDKLTFHGDIVKDYAPFVYAMNTNNILRDPNDKNAPKHYICYQSLWDSEVGTHLTVMIDDKSGAVTLLDYPKYSDLSNPDNVAKDEELQDYCKDMVNYYYYTVYDSGDNVEKMRREYALIWNARETNEPYVSLGNGERVDATEYDDALIERFGPWINPNYCGDARETGYWVTYLGESDDDTARADLTDLLFKPIVARAASNPKPYFDVYPYDFMDNYNNYLYDPNYGTLPDYKRVPDKVWTFINGTETVVVPDGVTSIDIKKYLDDTVNDENYRTYISGRSTESDRMYRLATQGATPGLFSGYYKDYDESDSRETNPIGNDRIKTITLTSVTSLPDFAFDNCEQLEKVEFGAVTEMGKLPFRGCPNLTRLTGSEKYPAENGIVYEKTASSPDSYTIVECLMARGKTGTGNDSLEKSNIGSPEPDSRISGVTAIADNAFEDCDGISIVDLSAATRLEIIPENCFNNCTGLANVQLPGSVRQIKDNAFAGISSDQHRLDVKIPGREVDISDAAFNPKRNVTLWSYTDSAAERYADRYYDNGRGIQFEDLGSGSVMFYDYDGTQIGTAVIVPKGESAKKYEPVEAEELKEKDHRPGYTFSGWEAAVVTDSGETNIITLDDIITSDMTIFIAQYESDGSMINGKYVVEFIDGIDGHRLSGRNSSDSDGKYYVEAGNSFMDLGWEAPQYADHTKEGKEFLQWSNNWTENTTIDANMTIIALYRDVATSGGSTNTSGGSTNTSRGSTSGGSSNTSRGSTSSSSGSTSSSSSSTSTTSSTSNTSSSTAASFTVTVVNGSGSGTYAQGSTVVIAANEPAAGMVFQKWTTESNGVTLASVSLPATTFTMPAGNVTVTANYVAATAPAANAGNNGNGGGNTGGSGSTRVDITKPGISNKDLATANANGTTDNFIVKITETDEATRAVAEALTNKYGSLDSILYYAMDISLWDSTGTYQLTGDQLAGITVDITIPIPDALVAYGGNNMAGAVVNGNQLENLNENFTTINGVPCIRFTASHFSPYTVYVDTGNLTEGMLDTTPKTGDPIHPKWFLSIGLACLSIILFMKKDKSAKVKTA